MKTKWIFFYLFPFFPFLINAQIQDYDIGEYFLPDLKYRALELGLNLSGGSVNQNYVNFSNEYLSSQHNFGLGIAYNSYSNRKHFQGNNFINLNVNGRYNYQESIPGNIDERLDLNAVFNWNNRNRLYFLKKIFFGIGGNVRFLNYTSLNFEEDLQSYSMYPSIGIPLEIGIGRIEDVTDAWHAVRTLQDLYELNLLSSDPIEDEITDLADLMANLHSDRIFDSRLARIRHISILDEHLENTGLLRERGASYFTSLNDMWGFGVQARRMSGTRLSFALTPTLNFTYFESSAGSENEQYHTGAYAGINYQYNKAISQIWQFDFFANLKIGYFGGELVTRETGFNYFDLYPNLNFNIACYPNSRTDFTLSLNAFYRSFFGEWELNSGAVTDIDQEEFRLTFVPRFNYYVSPRTRLIFFISIDYNKIFVENPSFYLPLPGTDFPSEGLRFNYGLSFKQAIF